MFRRRDVGKQKPKDYTISLYCNIVKKQVCINVQELVDGWPQKVIWKKAKACNCNQECNPKRPSTFPKECPAFKLEIKRQ